MIWYDNVLFKTNLLRRSAVCSQYVYHTLIKIFLRLINDWCLLCHKMLKYLRIIWA